jgi:peptidoglycan/LPS O-acetylase OafA/YrhL
LVFAKPDAKLGIAPSTGHDAYRPDIDGLRALSVLLVLGFHAFPRLVTGGFVGVDVFFVISGYLISGIIFSELATRQTFDLTDFYFRRVRRLFPALIVVLIATLLAGWLFLFPRDLIRLGRQAAAATAFVANLHFWKQSGYFAPSASDIPLLHLWSLGVEEQFYIFWPPLLMLLWRWRRGGIGAAIVAIAVASFALNVAFVRYGSFSFYFPLARAWELMLGAGLAWRPGSRARLETRGFQEIGSLAGLVLILSAAFLFREDAPYPGWRALAPTLGAVLMIWTGRDSWIGRKFLSAPAAVGLGLISYPLYLWHWPILWLARVVYPDAGPITNAAGCCVAIIAAGATYVLVERPIRRKFRFAPRRVAIGLISTMACVLAAAAVFSSNGLPGRWDDPAVRSLLTYKFDQKPYRERKCHLAPEQGPSEFAGECFDDNPSAKRRAVLWGDSAATAIYPGMKALADGSLNIAELTSSACPPFIEGYVPEANRPNCASINDFVFRYIEKSRPEAVILSSWPDYHVDYGRQYLGTISRLKALGVPTIVVVGPPPLWPEPLPRIILRSYFHQLARKLPDRVYLAPSALATTSQLESELSAAAKISGTIYVSAFQRLCNSDGACLAMMADEPSAWDAFHLTTGSSELVAKDIYEALRRTTPETKE